MTYDEALALYQNQTNLAVALGITQSTVSSWGGSIPPHYQYQLEIITEGKLRADESLRRPGALKVLMRKKGLHPRQVVFGRRVSDR